MLVAPAAAGAAVFLLLDRAVGLGGPVPESLDDDSWLISTRFPSPTYLAAAAAVTVVGKPWLGRAWRRTADRGLVGARRDVAHRRDVGARRAAAGRRRRQPRRCRRARRRRGTEPAAEPAGRRRRPAPRRPRRDRPRAGAGRRRPGPALPGDAGRRPVDASSRCTPATAATPTCCTAATARRCCASRATSWPAASLERDVEHEGLLLLLARRGGVRCPDLQAVTALPDGSMVVAMEDVDGRPLDTLDGRARRRAARGRVARDADDCTALASPTAPCGRPTSSSPTTVR